jgi:putative ABC transport system substrate-binding protein
MKIHLGGSMKLRLFLIGFLLCVITTGFAEPYKFCVAYFAPTPDIDPCVRGIIDGLKDVGLVQERDYTLSQTNVQGNAQSLPALVDHVAAENFDIIFTLSSPVLRAMSDRITNTPIIATYFLSPTIAGVVDRDGHQQANVTGVPTMTDFQGMVALIRQLYPNAKRLGTVYSPKEANSLFSTDALNKLAKQGGMTLVTTPAGGLESSAAAAHGVIDQNVDVVCQITDNTSLLGLPTMYRLASENGIPVFTFSEVAVQQGYSVIALAPDYFQCGKQAAGLAKRILNGEKPSDIAFGHAGPSKLVINRDLAKALKLEIPKELLKKADHIYVKSDKK